MCIRDRVDAISAFLADDVSMKRWGADVVFTGSQKALAVPPGISMMVLSSRAVERIYANRPACYYLDLKAALKNGERGQTPFTPAVGILIQINARLNQIKRDGFANVQAQIRAIAKDFRSRIGKYPFHIVSDSCLLYTSDAADEEDSVDLGGRRIIKKKEKKEKKKKKSY